MILRYSATIALIAAGACAQTVTIQEESGRCQAAIPSVGSVIANLHQSLTVQLDWEPDKVKALSGSELAALDYVKALENTNRRLWVEKDPKLVSGGNRAWHVFVPAGAGRCLARILFKPEVPEETVKKIALSVAKVR